MFTPRRTALPSGLPGIPNSAEVHRTIANGTTAQTWIVANCNAIGELWQGHMVNLPAFFFTSHPYFPSRLAVAAIKSPENDRLCGTEAELVTGDKNSRQSLEDYAEFDGCADDNDYEAVPHR